MSNKIFGLGFSHFIDNQEYFNELIQIGLQNGIKYFEGCSFYNNFNCENNLKLSLKNLSRKEYLLSNKLSYEVCEKHFNNNLEDYFNTQLKNCGVEYFDLYLIQYIDKKYFNDNKEPNNLFDLYYNFLLQKKKEGFIKKIGFVFHYYPEYFENCFIKYKWDYVQFSLNYYKWKYGYAKDLYKITLKYKVPIIAMEPLAMGLLADSKEVLFAAYNFLVTLNNIKIILSGCTDINHLRMNQSILNNFQTFNKNQLNDLNNYLELKQQNLCNCKTCIINCPQKIDLKTLILNKNNKNDKEKYYQFFEPFINNNIQQCSNCNICSQECQNQINFSNIIWKEIFPLRI